MKKLILTTALLISSLTFGQQFAVSIVQDAKLALKGDKIGNEPFTTNVIVNFELRGRDNGVGYVVMMPSLEYANLKGGDYYRYGVNGGYTFTGFIHFDITPQAGVGFISRKLDSWEGEATFYPSFNIGVDISVHIVKNVDLVLLNQLTDRKDLKMIWGHKQYFNYSFYAGIKYKF